MCMKMGHLCEPLSFIPTKYTINCETATPVTVSLSLVIQTNPSGSQRCHCSELNLCHNSWARLPYCAGQTCYITKATSIVNTVKQISMYLFHLTLSQLTSSHTPLCLFSLCYLLYISYILFCFAPQEPAGLPVEVVLIDTHDVSRYLALFKTGHSTGKLTADVAVCSLFFLALHFGMCIMPKQEQALACLLLSISP